jgi:hypothetical protein
MPAIYAITSDFFVLALTPVERWQAARRLDNTLSMQQWIYIVGAVCLFVSVAAYIFFFLRRRAGREADNSENFVEQAGRRGLSKRESRILTYVAKLASLKDHSTIFTMRKAFDIGAQKLVREASSGMPVGRIKQLAKELNWLREKLGFQERFAGSTAGATAGHKPSSREIPEGKTLYITRRTNRGVDDIEAIVVGNSDEGITVRLPMRVNSPPNEQWQVRYFYGASVWEFDVSVISSDGDILVLGHSEDIRFINRRRFLRVPVNRKAYIAPFPFEKQFFADSAAGSLSQGSAFESRFALPQFTPAVLMELAGPGLRIESSLELKIGQRVAVVFELESQRNQETHGDQSSDKPVATIAEGIGEVRHVKAVENGFSIAVELTGLSDEDINELIRATNVAAVEASGRNEKQDKTPEVLQSAASVLTM